MLCNQQEMKKKKGEAHQIRIITWNNLGSQ